MKTSELIGPALDWAVAKCEKVEYQYIKSIGGDYNGRSWTETRQYSTNWSQAGPIIERERIDPDPIEIWEEDRPVKIWKATINYGNQQDGPTPLIAAMRCYVTSKLGDEVDIPKELM